MIDCRVLGPAKVTVNGRPAPRSLLWRHNLAMMVYLARSPLRCRTREHLRGMLWPDKTDTRAARSLNQAILAIRRCLGAHDLESQPGQVHLAPDAVRLDTEQFAELAAAGDWAGAAGLVNGGFMEGFELSESSPFEDWLSGERREWDRRCVDALLRRADIELATGRLDHAAATARSAVRIAPLSESAVMSLMRALALDGDRTGALQEYEILVALLAEELGTRPGSECETLVERVRRERGHHRTSRKAEDERRRAPLIGRGADLERLWRLWQGKRAAGSAACALIVGDPGMGKTRLGDEVASRIRLDGATTIVIRAVESDLTVPWSGLIGLARGGLLNTPGLAGAPTPALAWFTQRIPEWADRFEVAPAVNPEAPARAFSEVLRAGLIEQPIALVVDDATLLDRESLLAIDGVLRDHPKHPLLVVLSTSAHMVRPEIDELRARIGRDVHGVVVHLAPFDAEDIGALAHWALPSYGDEQLSRVARRVGIDSAGVPLLVVELLSAVTVGLDLDKTPGAWPQPLHTLDDTLPGNLPEGVIGAIRVWFRHLSLPAQRVLQALAVLEDRVAADRLARAVHLPLEAVHDALDELEWNRWLTCDGRGYAFVARIVREVVNEDLVTPGQRQRIRDAAGPGAPAPPGV